ncbi:MAG: hypothetical protein IT514_00800 [Burkholderiales bacterium]|nr:hypothetical protein [Burkholderiales bacterium]
MFKLQVQDDDSDPASWHDVKGEDGKLLLFTEEQDARARLQALFPVLVGLEKYAAGHKRTRVLRVYGHDEDEGE